ncbi:adenosine receptor A3-like [Amphiura filiformis]|uniref:adenosine receptor A3-like n=1 Tax=Amphiura filiformis TaxID=82378 RepID=UPI003B2208BC
MTLPPPLLDNNSTTNDSPVFGDNPDEITEPNAKGIILFIASLALIVTILGGNGLVLVLLIKFRHLRTATNYFIIGMQNIGTLQSMELLAKNSTMNDSLLFGESPAEVTINEPTPLSAKTVILFISSLALIMTILGGNGLVLALLIKFRRLRTATNYFIIGMASADFIVGISLILHTIIALNPQLPISTIGCLLLRCTGIFPSVTSCLTLLFVSLDRYLKIVMPLRYHDLMSKKVAIMIVMSIYIYAALTIYGLPLSIANQTHDLICPIFKEIVHPFYLQFLVFVNILFPMCLMCIMYGQIIRVLIQKIRQERRIIPQQQPRDYNNLGTSRHLWLKRERRTIKTLVILLCLCIVGMVPICGLIFKDIFNPSHQIAQDVRNIIRYFTFLNSAVNPIVYSLRSEHFRVYTRKLFGISKKRKLKEHGMVILLL